LSFAPPSSTLSFRARCLYLLALVSFVQASWSLWALVALPALPVEITRGSTAGTVARVSLWILPGAFYLRKVYGDGWLAPLWLRIRGDKIHIGAIVLVTFGVSLLLIVGTARQRGLASGALVARLFLEARPDFQAPIMEELLFRGVIVGEVCRLSVHGAKSALTLRLRYWGAQLAAAGYFTLIHWPYWFAHQGLSSALDNTPPLMVTALVLGAVFVHTRSLWPCIFLHWLNNQLSVLPLT
jgi:membrane protease YdiL (CAAX protease family)